jgi:hypothetical protein
LAGYLTKTSFFVFWKSPEEMPLGTGCNRCVPSEDIVYNTAHEDTLRSAVRASKTAEDTMDMGSIAAANAVLDELIKDEKKEVSEVKKRSLGVEDPEVDLLAQEKALELMEITATQVMITKIKVSSGRLEVQDDKMELVKEHEEKARRLIEANIVLAVIPSSEKKTREVIASSAAGKARGKDGKSFVGIFLDQGMFGEPITAPHIRLNAVNQTVTKVCGCQIQWEPYCANLCRIWIANLQTHRCNCLSMVLRRIALESSTYYALQGADTIE